MNDVCLEPFFVPKFNPVQSVMFPIHLLVGLPLALLPSAVPYKTALISRFRAGLSIVPVVPWEGAPAARGPQSAAKIFNTLFWCLNVWTFSVGLHVSTTTKKGQLFGEKCTARENPGYAYEKRAHALRWYPPRMVNPTLFLFIMSWVYTATETLHSTHHSSRAHTSHHWGRSTVAHGPSNRRIPSSDWQTWLQR